MLELELSLIGGPNPALTPLLEAFQAQHHIRVKLRNMTWENAWPELLTFALPGTGPDISHIGSTWAGSLVAMNALRPFTPAEVKAWGGADLNACWQSGLLHGQSQVWALPWTSFTFILCYRRDLLRQAGVDEASAFTSAEALASTAAQWSKVENQLGAALSEVSQDVLAGIEPAAALRERLDPLAQRLEITLGG